MATDDKIHAKEVFWTSYDSDDSQSMLVHVPGLRSEGNLRVKGKRAKEVILSKQPVTPAKKSEIDALQEKNDTNLVDSQLLVPEQHKGKSLKNMPENRGKSCLDSLAAVRPVLASTKALKDKVNGKQLQASDKGTVTGKAPALKDLCPEDKQRVANLVKELARVGEEKENFKDTLQQERVNFEQQIQDVLAQQAKILGEREVIQKQLFECQRLLSRYQTILLDQHDAPADTVTTKSGKTKKKSSSKNGDKEFRLSPKPDKVSPKPGASSHEHVYPETYLSEAGDQDKFEPEPRQHSNLQRGVHQGPSAGHQAADLGEVTRSHTPAARKLPPASTERPFTNMIDKLIAQEKHNGTYGHDMCGGGQVKSEIMGVQVLHPLQELQKDSLFGLGPLAEPAMASSQHSEGVYLVGGAKDTLYPQGLCKEEFLPMQPDSSHSSLQSPPHTPHMNSYSPDVPLYNGLQDTSKALPVFPQPPDMQQDSGQFTAFYQQLTPAERKRQLQAQKAALLSEQRRLRHVLSEQEALLHSKQEQLHQQQQRQRQRLSFFQQAGYFPPSSVNGHSPSGQEPSYHSSQGGMHAPQMPAQYPTHSMHSGLHMNTMGAYSSPGTSSAPMPYLPPGNPHLAQTDYSQPGTVPLQPQMLPPDHRQYYPEQGMDMGPYPQATGAWHYSSGVQQQGHGMPSDGVSESMENLHFLERHGINVAHMRRPHRKGLEMPEMRSAATSPLRPAGLGSMSRYTDAETQFSQLENAQLAHHIEALNSHRGDTTTGCMKQGNRSVDPSVMSMSRLAGYDRSDMMPPTDHAAYLLDIVDEVESEHSRSHDTGYHGYPMPQHQQHHLQSMGSFSHYGSDPSEMHSMDDLEESRVLDEVFFVK